MAGTTGCILVAKFISKRSLYMICIGTATILNLWLGKKFQLLQFDMHRQFLKFNFSSHSTGVYGLYYLPENARSYENAQILNDSENGSYLPVILVVVWRFVTAAILNVPIMYASELFPLKSRCIAAGISVGTTYIYLFVAMKTFYNLESWLNMSQTFCLYAVIGVIG